MSDYAISFIVPVLNDVKLIGRCLAHIRGQALPHDEIIVVDNGSTDGTLEVVKQFRNVRLLDGTGLRVGALRNRGAATARNELLAFVDSDCLLCEGWRGAVEEVLRDPGVAATGSKYDLPDDPCWIEKVWFSQRRLRRGNVNYINSGNLIVRKGAFEMVGGFDETLVTGEDAELGFRLNKNGHRVYEEPRIRAVHLGNPKTLPRFYRQQVWHGLGMFGTMRISRLDKPVAMTFGFLMCTIAAMGMIVTGRPLSALWLVLAVPLTTSLYRVFQFGNATYFFHLAFLYLIYFAARVNALFKIVLPRSA